MIETAPGQTFTATTAPGIFAAGLAGALGIKIERPDGTEHTARTTAGIVEIEPGSTVYAKDDLVAPIETGLYVVLWDDGAGQFASEELAVAGVGSGLTPSVAEVAMILRARTKGAGGLEIGAFTENTRPTGDQVEETIAWASGRVLPQLDADPVPERHHAAARTLVAIYAAMFVELSYFPEQVNREVSIYDELKDLFDAELEKLNDRLADTADGGEVDAAVGMPSHTFDTSESLIGRRTEW